MKYHPDRNPEAGDKVRSPNIERDTEEKETGYATCSLCTARLADVGKVSIYGDVAEAGGEWRAV